MILIPGGEFVMGDDDTVPRHNRRQKVTLPGYHIYKNLVTVEMYEKFCVATGRSMPPVPVERSRNLSTATGRSRHPLWDFNRNWSNKEHPIVNVSWEDAKAYCDWAGVKLPGEAQWEKAARGTDGRKYPWGNTFDRSKLRCSKTSYFDAGGTAPVGSFPKGASPYGVLDMAGNVWQWCEDGAQVGMDKYKVLKGGSWANTYKEDFQCAVCLKSPPAFRYCNLGFRCVVPVRTNVSRVKAPEYEGVEGLEEIDSERAVEWLPPRPESIPGWDPPDVSFRGRVEVKVMIDADGRHTEEMTRRTGVAELDAYLKRFFAGWDWNPKMVDGKRVKSTTTFRCRFQ
jgi:serine/threonine-protein kinase